MEPSVIWLAGLFISSISVNISLFKIVIDDKIARPIVVSLILNRKLLCAGWRYLFICIDWTVSCNFLYFIQFNIIFGSVFLDKTTQHRCY